MYKRGDSVRVTDAPGYEDFTASVILHEMAMLKVVVVHPGDELTGSHLAVVPEACVELIGRR